MTETLTMQANPEAPHPGDDMLELYSLGRLDDTAAAALEEHLLVCPHCQQQLDELDLFTHAARQAARELLEEAAAPTLWDRVKASLASGFAMPASRWVAAGSLAAVIGLMAPMLRQPAALTVELAAMRGVESATAAAGHPLTLRVDLTGLPNDNCCEAELVTASGSVMQHGAVRLDGGQAILTTGQLTAGQYWVRIYTKSGEALRETGLTVR